MMIRTMNRAELDIAISWAAAAGWNPGLYDSDCFYTADPDGFLIGFLNDEPIATISAVKYGQSFGFIGFYIVKPEYRGQGFGMQIWSAALESLKSQNSGRNIGLDGVLAQQNNYRKSGFQLAYRNIRYQGSADGDFVAETPLADISLVPLTTLPFETIAAYDRPFFPSDRTQFLQCWIHQPESEAWGILQNGKLAGYGVLRVCQTGYKIGPLFADNAQLAESLFLALQAKAQVGTPIYWDIPEINPAAVRLAEQFGMQVVFETARMYTGASPELPFDRLFGVTTFELG
jgi:ribosomal protein S18 acetylase RimI-like enzyme